MAAAAWPSGASKSTPDTAGTATGFSLSHPRLPQGEILAQVASSWGVKSRGPNANHVIAPHTSPGSRKELDPRLPHTQVKASTSTTQCACRKAKYLASDSGVFKGAGSDSGLFKGAGPHLKERLTRDLEFLTLWSRLKAPKGRGGRDGMEPGAEPKGLGPPRPSPRPAPSQCTGSSSACSAGQGRSGSVPAALGQVRDSDCVHLLPRRRSEVRSSAADPLPTGC